MITSEVLVIGAGIGGLSLALALAQQSLAVTIVDARVTASSDEWGHIIWPPGTRSLAELGLLDRVRPIGCALGAFRWYRPDGREYFSAPLHSVDGSPFLAFVPSMLRDALKEAAVARGVTLIEGATPASTVGERGGFTVSLEGAAGPVAVTTRVVVGADGHSSLVRRQIGARSRRWQPPRQVIRTTLGGAATHADSRQVIAGDCAFGSVALGGGRTWLYAFERRAGRSNRTAESPSDAALESLCVTREAWVDARRRFHEVAPSTVSVSPWAGNGMVLTGDAAHTIVPHLGLGGSLALEDGPILAEILVDALRRGGTSASALGTFEQRRRRRIALAARASNWYAGALTTANPVLRFCRDRQLDRLASQPDRIARLIAALEAPSRAGLPAHWQAFAPVRRRPTKHS